MNVDVCEHGPLVPSLELQRRHSSHKRINISNTDMIEIWERANVCGKVIRLVQRG
jgi:hypothetical protein